MTSAWWMPLVDDAGLARVTAPVGLAIHAVVSGRVTDVDTVAVGTVIVRDAAERFHHYRRLRAQSIIVVEDEMVAAGQVLGVVASAADDAVPSFLYGLTDAEGNWLDAADFVAGATDPGELGLAGDATADVDPLYERSRRVDDQPETTADSLAVVLEEPVAAVAESPSPEDSARPTGRDRSCPEPERDDDPLAGGGIPRGL